MIMDTKVVWKDRFQVVGMKIRYQPSETKPSENEITRLWQRFNPRCREITGRTGGMYGLMVMPPDMKPGDPFDYLAGCGVSETGSVPEGMVAESYPGGLYCVVTRKGPIDELHQAFHYFWEKWLPESEYDRAAGAEFEYYDERYRGNANVESVMELWFPIRSKRPAPIENRVASVFVHVTDLRRSAEWYSRLLGLPLMENRLNGGPVYWFDLPGTGLILDSNVNNRKDPNWREEMKPRFMFPASDIDEAYAYLSEKAEVFHEPERHRDMAYFTFRDPEGNALMACWNGKPGEEPKLPATESPVLARIKGVFVDVKEMKATAAWYADLLALPFNESASGGAIYPIAVTRSAGLMLDHNRHRHNDSFSIPFMFDCRNIDEAYAFVKTSGIEVFGSIERYGQIAFFTVKDPDDNLVMICEG
ncbi:effector binding domain-containing protein [Paenibacillus allorhizosphaerae]|uniref:VOC domain-containing protein n=1 Tax=Paenibacillus allorhizosphaerae TaxID=2849866 RepID=A0ABM8VP86_9BACL|nr:effector binding domain-containing protein [Paenibacillus allorhizosphaerae]CAG7652263.1 hypothetical protein PAECIP111802_05179 [Paenibacillus allorhizosphaerae]